MRIKTRLLILTIPLTIIITLSMAILSFFSSKNALLVSSMKHYEAVAEFKSRAIQDFFKGLEDGIAIAQDYYDIKLNLPIVSKLAENRDLPDYVKAKEILDRQLRKWLKTREEVTDIMLTNPEGKIVYSANKVHVKLDLDEYLPDPEGKAFEEGRHGVFISRIFRSPSKEYGYDFGLITSAPILDVDNRFIGVIAFEINMEPIYRFIQDTTGLGETGETLVVRKESGHILFLNPLRHDIDAALKRKVLIGDKMAIPAQEAVIGRNGSGVVRDYRGKEVLAAWRFIPELGWGIVAKIDLREVLVPIVHLRNLSLIFCAVVILFAIIASLVIAESISRPIHILHRGTEIIGEGNLDYRTGIKGKSEIAQLSRAFDRMAGNLKETTASQDELNKEINKCNNAEDALRNSTAQYRAIVHSAANAIVSADETGNIVDWNSGARAAFGYTYVEVIGQPLTLLMPLRYRDRHLAGIARMRSGGEPRIIGKTIEIEGLRKDGSEFPLELSLAEWQLSGRRQYTAIMRDITERRQLLAHKDNFMSMVSHELRTPLAAIKESISLVSEGKAGPIAEEQKEMIDIAKRNVDRLARLINDVLNLQKIDAGKMEFKPDECDINEAIGEVHRTMISLAAKKGLSFTLSLDGALPKVKFDKDRILEVLTNLINNAIKFTENGGITITSGRSDNSIRVSVKDTGIGIKAEDMPKLFQRFSQLERRPGGTGLGLAISKEIIDAHGGRIVAESEYGKGSAFYFTLPV